MIKHISTALVFLLCATVAFSQDTDVAMADGMRSSGKIYVVVAVLCFILLGIGIYLARLDRKISRLEKDTTPGKL